jgi:serine/threonine protein kinase
MATSLPYVKGRVLGRGAFGTVYLGTRIADGLTVAMKEISLRHIPESCYDRLMEEVRMLSRLRHPGVVQFIEGVLDARSRALYIVMEYCAGGDLEDFMDSGKMTIPLARRMLRALLKALSYIHASSIIHRDIKVGGGISSVSPMTPHQWSVLVHVQPANILLTGSGVPKIADLGVAASFADNGGSLRGTCAGVSYWFRKYGAASYNCCDCCTLTCCALSSHRRLTFLWRPRCSRLSTTGKHQSTGAELISGRLVSQCTWRVALEAPV